MKNANVKNSQSRESSEPVKQAFRTSLSIADYQSELSVKVKKNLVILEDIATSTEGKFESHKAFALA
jgi:hypothetical protein